MQVLVLDEPHLKPECPLSVPVIRRLLAAYPGNHPSISHDRKFLNPEVCTEVYHSSIWE